MRAAIDIQGLTKVYGFAKDEVKAVDSLELQIDKGEVFGFLGPNGAGKTTTVQMLMSIIFPSSGTASLLGKPLGNVEARNKIGFLPELFQFHSFLKADEFLHFHASLYGMRAAERKVKVGEVLEQVGLSENSNSRIGTFSKGMLQRIGIGQAIINDPDLIFLDEPTSALDPIGRRDVRDLILRLRDKGTTIFLNSHMLSEVEMTCGRIGILNKGKLIRISDLDSLIKPAHCVDVVADELSQETKEKIHALASRVEEDNGRLAVTLEREDQIRVLARLIMDSGANLLEFTPRQVPLEDVFMQTIEENA